MITGEQIFSSEESHKSYRPFTVMTFRMNYAYGELDPFGYHFGNVILHGICTFLMLIYLKQNQSILILPQNIDLELVEKGKRNPLPFKET